MPGHVQSARLNKGKTGTDRAPLLIDEVVLEPAHDGAYKAYQEQRLADAHAAAPPGEEAARWHLPPQRPAHLRAMDSGVCVIRQAN